jgi:hypothetical protein
MPAQRWEYKSVRLEVAGWLGPKVDTDQLDATLSALGAQGWELVSAFDVNRTQGASDAIIALFKRSQG